MTALLQQAPWPEAGWKVEKEWPNTGERLVIAFVHVAFHGLACAYAEACSVHDPLHNYVVTHYEHENVEVA